MPRKDRKTDASNNEIMQAYVLQVYEKFSIDELKAIAYKWCSGDYYANHCFPERACKPIAVTIAALLTVDHPLLCRPDGQVFRTMMDCATLILGVMLDQTPVEVPLIYIPQVVHMQTVDRKGQV